MIQLLIMAVLLAVVFVGQTLLYKKLWNRQLTVDLNFQPMDMFEGDEGCLTEQVTNDKWLPLPLFHVKFQTDRSLLFDNSASTQKTDQYYRNDAFRIGKHEKLTRNLTFRATKRGYYKINGLDLVANDLFLGTSWFEKRQVDRYLYVYPRPFYSREFLRSLQMVNGLMQTRSQFLEDPFEHRGIREYQPYDDMKRINWKATAKTGDLKVNLRDFTAVRGVRIFLNLEDTGILKKEDCAEACIRMATGVAQFFMEKGMKVSCYGNCRDAYTDKLLCVESECRMPKLYRELACIDLNKEMPDFCTLMKKRLLHAPQGEYTFVISVNAYDDFLALLQEYKLLSGDFLWFYPINDKSVKKIPADINSFCRMINIYRID